MEHDLMGGISPLLVYISLDRIIFIDMQMKFKSREGVCCSTEDDLQEGGSVSATLLIKTQPQACQQSESKELNWDNMVLRGL